MLACWFNKTLAVNMARSSWHAKLFSLLLLSQRASAYVPHHICSHRRFVRIGATSNPSNAVRLKHVIATSATVVSASPLEVLAEETKNYEILSNNLPNDISAVNSLLSNLPDLLDNTNPFMNDPVTYLGGLSISELAGNLAFICVAAAYLNTEILVLRLLAMGGIGLSIVFQYYRDIPLWIPIRWNVLLLCINAAMATTLILERRRAEQMSPELARLYQLGHFENRGFSRVEFCKLFDVGTKVKLKSGDTIARDGVENVKL